MQYTIELPYVQAIQIPGLKIPIHIWYDGPGKKLRMDVYGGLDSTYILPDFTYNTFPRILKKSCLKINNTVGPTSLQVSEDEGLQPPLPDISNWLFSGAAKLPNGMLAYVWTLTENHQEKTNTYTFYTAQEDGRPLKLYMAGVNILSGSHFDQYIVDFVLFFNNLFPGAASIFKPPALCNPASTVSLHPSLPKAVLHAAPLALLPSSLLGGGLLHESGSEEITTLLQPQLVSTSSAPQQGSKFLDRALTHSMVSLLAGVKKSIGDLISHSTSLLMPQRWSSTTGTALSSSSSASLLLQSSNRILIEAWNRDHSAAQGFKLSMNRFASMSQAQFLSTSLGHIPSSGFGRNVAKPGLLGQQRKAGGGGYLGVFQRKLKDEELPVSVDYRGTGADGIVKDQAFCGSCWAFAATGTMTGTWFKATGQALSLSEQQIVDCAWDQGNNGCWGGNGGPAMEFVWSAGGAGLEDAYPYIGQNGYCKSNNTDKVALFSGYEIIHAHDELALMEALATRGPLYVALDAVHPTFKFYSEGVYHRDDCGSTEDDLNHAVTLVGYGTTTEGVDYWLIRNSWSKLWGEDGYMKITRKGNDCGITLAAVQSIVDEAAAKGEVRRVMAA
ncbi:hypothetical protein CEUSTIGMA_g8961.t1 [Chlamydomonas eustigma]|uniref:Peptidase C1A papain C-terminal domain-containing protein n=1 Tax=Chlamydomonas eustigma TaxID=1157962 RepID=A0A250XEQ0_9CHLO|nr:hypothetical protein CEUSTIGMA_g8961.t1 [Chlamydomonas eustigma]|eukprot:GAX81533.1 hypothetical protein CEUSTIGMA_g8961.t1 [Chlamydomonas eustigma]